MMVRSRLIRLTLVAALIGTLSLSACAPKSGTETGEPGGKEAKPGPMKIGTLATQDALPLWVAEQKGYFAENGLTDIQVVTFQSAQECQAAFSSGAVDALMTDLIVATKLQASGTKVVIPTIMLGSNPQQGRFAIVASPSSSATKIGDLANVPVGTASATITEYVLDKLMEEAGVPADQVKKEEVDKVPVRFQLMMSGQLQAASLPEPLVSLAVLQGAKIVEGGDDTLAKENISQSVLAVNREFADSAAGGASLEALLKAWDKAVADINADPDSFRTTLVEKAGLPQPLATSYQVSEYPKAAPPSVEDIQRVLDWMKQKGYLKADVTPQDLLGTK